MMGKTFQYIWIKKANSKKRKDILSVKNYIYKHKVYKSEREIPSQTVKDVFWPIELCFGLQSYILVYKTMSCVGCTFVFWIV